MPPSLDLSLYLVIGSDVTARRPVADIVRQAVEGGVTAVQLREKHRATRAFVEEARALVALLRPLGVPLIVNDRVDVALAAGADGVHVGQDDMAVRDVRRIVGPEWIVGLSVTTLAEAGAVDTGLVTYVGVGPVFATSTKPDAAPPLGLGDTAEICRTLRAPVVAIGGIGAENAAEVLTTGVHGIAVVSAICSARRPREAAALLTAQLSVGRRT
jgi:thiamine-phosphate pyrophosphorylase